MTMKDPLTVHLSGGGPWGFRLQGGAGTGAPLVVAKVRRKSRAYRRLLEGDRVVSVNGTRCDRLTYDRVMEIADGCGDRLTLQVLRHEPDQEPQMPAAEEIVTLVDTKITKETEGLRIESVALLDDPLPPLREAEPPPFSDISQGATLEREEAVVRDESSYEKTTTETIREEAVSRVGRGDMPDITLDTIDLNELISATQKKLDSLKDSFRADTTSSRLFESHFSSAHTTDATLPSLTADLHKIASVKKVPPPTLPKPKGRPFSDSFLDGFRDLQLDLDGSLGLVASDTESSCVTSETPFGSTLITKKKKMFSSSSFYEEPQAIYPTMEEQVEMAKKIADSLADDTNKKSKGANMFFKRVKKSTKWIHEGGEEEAESGPEIPPTPDPSVVPWKSLGRGTPSLRLLLDPRHTEDAFSLRSSGRLISEHNVVSPQVCHGLVKDLHSPVGKGAALFAKRQKKSEEWVVDEERVKALMVRPAPSALPPLHQDIGRVGIRSGVDPDRLADTVIRAADYKRTTSVTGSPTPQYDHLYTTTAPQYDHLYTARAPKGWLPAPTYVCASPTPQVSQPAPRDVFQNGYPAKKLVFRDFNAVPRLWRGST